MADSGKIEGATGVDALTDVDPVETAGNPAIDESRGGELSAPTVAEGLTDEARLAAERLAALGTGGLPLPSNLGKKEVERFVEQIVPAKIRNRQRIVREISREVMGKQPYERGRYLVPIALRHTLPTFLSDTKFIATLSSEPLRQALDPKQPREVLDHNRRVLIEGSVAFMGGWNPEAVRTLVETPDQLSGVLVFNVYPAVISSLRRYDPEAEARARAEEAVAREASRHARAAPPELDETRALRDNVRWLGFVEDARTVYGQRQRGEKADWDGHIQQNSAGILKAASQVDHQGKGDPDPAKRPVVMILGAGYGMDIPLKALVKNFRVILVDHDENGPRESILRLSPEERKYVSMEVRDLSGGVVNRITTAVREILKKVDNPKAAYELFQAMINHEMEQMDVPDLVGENRVDLLVSTMLISQMGVEPTFRFQMEFANKFGAEALPKSDFNELSNLFDSVLQTAHAWGLAQFVEQRGGVAYYASDVFIHYPSHDKPLLVVPFRGNHLGDSFINSKAFPGATAAEKMEWTWNESTMNGSRTVHAVIVAPTSKAHARASVREFLNSPDFTPMGLIDLLKQDPELKDLWSVVVLPQERFTLEEHTLLVMRQFEKYFGNATFPKPFDRGFFRLILALHDIGKPRAVNEGAPHKHHAYTAEIMAKTLRRFGYDEAHVKLAVTMVTSDLGRYVMGIRTLVKYPEYLRKGYEERIAFYENRIRTELGLTAEEAEEVISEIRATGRSPLQDLLLRNALANLRKSAEAAGMPIREFFDLRLIYYMCDAGAYTTNATGEPQLGTTSAFDDMFHFDLAENRMHFAEPWAAYMARLREEVGRQGEKGTLKTPPKDSMVSLEVNSPDIFDQLADQSVGLRTLYPVISPQVAREVLGPVDDNFVLQDGAITQARLTYLDGAATTKFLPTTYATFQAYAQHVANTHSLSHLPARITDHNYHLAHEILLRFAHANPDTHTAIFTGQGTTDAILHIARTLFDRHAVPDTRDTVIFSGSEHHANILPWLYYAPRAVGVPVEDKERGTLPIEGIRKMLAENKGRVKVVAITGTSNVTGILSNIREVAKIVHEAGALLLVDAAHLFGHVMGAEIEGMGLVGMKEMGIDILVGSGHKVYAPGAPGFLIMPKSLSRPIPARVGGGIVLDVDLKRAVFMDTLPDREEAGTPPFVGAIMLASSLTLLEAIGMKRVWDHERELTRTAIGGLSAVEGVKVYGDNDIDRTPRAGVVSFSIEGLHHAVVSRALFDYFSIATRNGCFCAQPYLKSILELEDDEIEASVAAVTSGDRSKAPGLVRAGFGVYTVKKDVERLLAAVRWVSQNKDRLNAEYAVHKNGSATRNDGWTVDPASYAILPTVEGGRVLMPAAEVGEEESGGLGAGSRLLMGGFPLVGGVGLDGVDLSWVPTAGAGVAALAAGLATLMVGTRYFSYRRVKKELDTALAEWPLIHQEFVSSLRTLGRSISFLDFPDKEAETWILKPAIAEQRLRMSLAILEEVERHVNQFQMSFQAADTDLKNRLLNEFVTHMKRFAEGVHASVSQFSETPFNVFSTTDFIIGLQVFLESAQRGLAGRPAVELLAGRLTSQIHRSLERWEEKIIEEVVENYASPTWVESVHRATLNVFSDAGQAKSAELDHIVSERSQRLIKALKILSRIIRENPHRNPDFPLLVKKLRQGSFEVEGGEGNRIEELSLALQSYATVLSDEFVHSAELVERVWERLAVVSQRGAVSTYEIDVMERNLAFWVVPGRPLTGRTPIVHLFVEQIAFKINDSRSYLEKFRDQPAVVVFDPKKATATKEGMDELESNVRLMIAEQMGIHPNKVQLKTHVFSGEVKPLQPTRAVRLVGGSSPIRLVSGTAEEEGDSKKGGQPERRRVPARPSIWGTTGVFSLGRRGIVPVR